MESSGRGEIAVAVATENKTGSGRPLELDEHRIAKKARVESEEDTVDLTKTPMESHSMTNSSASPVLKDGIGIRGNQSGQHQQQPAIPQNMYGIPPNGLPGVAAANYQSLLLLAQSQQSGNNGNMIPQGSMQPQQMWMNHPVLAQALGLNFYQKGDGTANMQNVATMGAFSLPGGLMHQMHVPVDANMTGRHPTVIYMSCDDDSLSEYQCLVRKQIELFEARREDVDSNAQGRNRPIVMGQVGIRCRHCTMLPPKHRARGAIYYPAKLYGLYQAAQNMASSHLCEHCQHVPHDVRAELLKLRDRKSSAGGGKKYWADGVRILGVFEDEDGLRYEKR